MTRRLGTVAMGVRTPIVKEGDDIVQIVVDSTLEASKVEGFEIKDKDIIGITESLVARAQGNFCPIDDITEDLNNKYENHIGVVFPIFSRNRFSLILEAIVNTGKEITLLLSYPSDEVGNQLIPINKIYENGINPLERVLTEKEFREYFGNDLEHEFTGVDYVKLYSEIGKGKMNIVFSNNPVTILNYTDEVFVANIHARKETKQILKDAGARTVYGQEDILVSPRENGRGYNPEFGILGSNMAAQNELKLFPRDSQKYVDAIHEKIKELTGKSVEVLVYGDGAFKDPVGGIWELADPVVSPAYTKGLEGVPHEIKIKYIADTELKDSDNNETIKRIKNKINEKENKLKDDKGSLGTTPRQITDLVGTLCDLMSGSGDKGTPVVLIKGYFDNFASE